MLTYYLKPQYRQYNSTTRIFLGYKRVRTSWIALGILVIIAAIIAFIITRPVVYSIDTEIIKPVPFQASDSGIISAYTLSKDETDNSPCIGAFNIDLCQLLSRGVNIVANNCLESGTLVKIDDKIYIVLDRMNSRWSCDHYDIVMKTKAEAIKFRRKLQVIIY